MPRFVESSVTVGALTCSHLLHLQFYDHLLYAKMKGESYMYRVTHSTDGLCRHASSQQVMYMYETDLASST